MGPGGASNPAGALISAAMIHLDTSFLIRVLTAGSPEAATMDSWTASGEVLRVSAVAWAEFLCGPVSAGQLELAARIVGNPADFTAQDATVAARLFNATGRRRGTMPDCMIAAAALRYGAPLATGNIADFRRFAEHGLRLA